MAELKECLFCRDSEHLEIHNQSKSHYVECLNCGARGPTNSEKDCYAGRKKAIEAWNRLPSPSTAPLTLEELRKMDVEPVYLVYPSGQSANHWEIIYLVVQQYDANGAPIGDEWVIMTSGASERANDYAKTWLAYRRKPEEDA